MSGGFGRWAIQTPNKILELEFWFSVILINFYSDGFQEAVAFACSSTDFILVLHAKCTRAASEVDDTYEGEPQCFKRTRSFLKCRIAARPQAFSVNGLITTNLKQS